MRSYPDTYPGAPWRPEPAERYNAVNDVLRRFDRLGAGGFDRLNLRGQATITALYTGGSALPAYSLLAISGGAVAESGDPCNAVFIAPGAADASSPLYGVATSPATSGATVGVVLAGITPVRVASGGICSGGEMLAPTSGGAATLGAGKIQALGEAVSVAGGHIAPALLGGNGGGGATLAAVVTMPLSGGGIGAISPVTLGSGGEITITSGATIPAKFPYLDGYN